MQSITEGTEILPNACDLVWENDLTFLNDINSAIDAIEFKF